MKQALRETQTLRAGCSKVRTPPARPPARALPQTHRQDRLQYTAPLASAQCNEVCSDWTRVSCDRATRGAVYAGRAILPSSVAARIFSTLLYAVGIVHADFPPATFLSMTTHRRRYRYVPER